MVITKYPPIMQIHSCDTVVITFDQIAGSHIIILKLANYFNDTSIVAVTAEYQFLITRWLVSDKSTTTFGPIKIWESGDTSISYPNGIILKSGLTSSISSGSNSGVDIYYSTPGGLVLATMYDKNARSTSFWLGNASVLTDGVPSPVYSGNWTTQIATTLSYYFYLYDDRHYSKMIIIQKGNDGHELLSLEWIYNNMVDDIRF